METDILQQRAATSLNVESSIMALSVEHATELFSLASHRLLSINKWHTLPCSLLTALKLTDEKGCEIDRQVRENDYFVVDNEDGHGEWVKIEKVYLHRDPSGPREVLAVRAKPSNHPLDTSTELNRPCNTFKVTRDGLNITVSVHGKNEDEELNKAYSNPDDKHVRPDTTVGAIPGVARVQWRSLVHGILSTWA